MVARNPDFKEIKSQYLFSEIEERKKAIVEDGDKIISLSIGDTTQALTNSISRHLKASIEELSQKKSYKGYGPAFGLQSLRAKIAEHFYASTISEDEVFISDGAKCDLARLQFLFHKDASIAIQDPSYPAYIDIAKMRGNERKIVFMPCNVENNFFPELKERTDLIIFCSPNNPTGAKANKEQLQRLVSFAKNNKSIIIFDTAYAAFSKSGPRSIYEIEGAEEVAIEVGSFSKFAGFSGIRLGWTVVPKTLCYDDKKSVYQDYCRVQNTFFNGASRISQAGGIAVLQEIGLKETMAQVNYYMENAKILREALAPMPVYGGSNCPYLWLDCKPKTSWEAFEDFLKEIKILSIPGSGFGPSGEGFLRLSALASREDCLQAASRIKHYLKNKHRKVQ